MALSFCYDLLWEGRRRECCASDHFQQVVSMEMDCFRQRAIFICELELLQTNLQRFEFVAWHLYSEFVAKEMSAKEFELLSACCLALVAQPCDVFQ